jgi:hypothetical protein
MTTRGRRILDVSSRSSQRPANLRRLGGCRKLAFLSTTAHLAVVDKLDLIYDGPPSHCKLFWPKKITENNITSTQLLKTI